MAENNSPLDIYEIQGTIGKGGGGTVYKAIHKRLQKEVVIKKIHDSVRAEERRNEVDVLKNLRHSYIPSVLDYFVIDGVSYTVMDYIEGESFQSLLDRGVKFKESQVIKYGKQLCEAVEYLHSREIPVIHGDIKPDNIMLKPDDDICLIDFNISGISEGNQAYTNGFTKGYSAPEQEEAFYRIVEELKKNRAGAQASTATAAAGHATPTAGGDETEVLDNAVGGDETEVLSSAAGDVTEVLGSSGDETEVLDSTISSGDETEVIGSNYDPDATEVLEQASNYAGAGTNAGVQSAGFTASEGKELPKIPIDKRSDVYSIGATLYHIYTGVRLDKAGNKALKASTSEGYLYILNKALQEKPSNRFASAGEMLKAFNNIHRKEKTYRAMVLRQNLVRIALLITLVAGVGLISYGFQKKEQEREELYAQYIEQMAAYDPEGDEAGFEQIFQSAIALKPDTVDAYEKKAYFLFQRRQYEDTNAFVEGALQTLPIYEEETGVANLYHINGNAYYEQDNFEKAAENFRNGLKYDSKNPEIYGDYAISLAKKGDLNAAAEAAEKAEEYGINTANLSQIHGEIEYAKGNYGKAEEYLKECIATTSDDYRKMRAYITCAQAISAGGTVEDLDRSIDFLTKGLTDVSMEYRGYLTGLLSENYIQAYGLTEEDKYCDGAIKYSKELIDTGWASYSTYNNIIILCTNSGRFDEAASNIDLMEKRYPDNYNVYKRKAFLELEIQQLKEETERDFSAFEEYYNEALKRYEKQAGEKRDPEMDLLKDDLQVLKDGNWL